VLGWALLVLLPCQRLAWQLLRPWRPLQGPQPQPQQQPRQPPQQQHQRLLLPLLLLLPALPAPPQRGCPLAGALGR
jgi:hypothetical protein